MPVKAGYALGACVKMLTKSVHDFSIIFVGKRWKPSSVGTKLQNNVDSMRAQGKLLEVDTADFGILFVHIDAFIVHGGLGTTVEALRTGKPVAISGCLLFDQRFWCELLGRHTACAVGAAHAAHTVQNITRSAHRYEPL